MKTNTIAVIGGTGKSGKYLVQNLLEKRYPMKLLWRKPEDFKMQDPLIEIVKGDVRDEEAVHSLIEGCNIVISTLGQPKEEKSVFSDAAKNIIRTMNHYGIKRYIVTTGLSVNTSTDQKNDRVKMATEWMYQNYPETTSDKQKEYRLLLESDLDWTLVRLPLITLTDRSCNTEISLIDCKGENISAADLAEFLVSQIEDSNYIRESPFLYNI
ncbi:Putative NADH-flavin reductase [Chryseobacterium nakagawai]|uniref:NAD-dependent epimerase/dehydratase family protein n=1 Tax=Chryseobacterium nakagawai TaxID=1241982 RepID=A0AAD0YHH9_CHRNA|nr:NAD(P)H-binding protein [Chryseobacterium nakagawai]AZA89215.1 NAD-dependent epimerase/dehydratase family protein [Chryseobacterium nakagawai]VEH20544.1 Putative NADH-flavin reductase [Chryseobacterium nakagawai]